MFQLFELHIFKSLKARPGYSLNDSFLIGVWVNTYRYLFLVGYSHP